jgi:TonB family protein
VAQTNDATKTEPKKVSPEPPAGPQKEAASGKLEVLTDTMGVDFGPYLNGIVQTVRKNWYTLIPASGKLKSGRVSIQFVILKDGSVSGIQMFGSSGDVALDRAAWGGITAAAPFPPLPAEFKGPYLALRMQFSYNPGFSISPPGPVKVLPGTTQQFSTTLGRVNWAIAGDPCLTPYCGSVSPTGLYTAPPNVPTPRNISIEATQTSAPFKSASVQVRLVPTN